MPAIGTNPLPFTFPTTAHLQCQDAFAAEKRMAGGKIYDHRGISCKLVSADSKRQFSTELKEKPI